MIAARASRTWRRSAHDAGSQALRELLPHHDAEREPGVDEPFGERSSCAFSARDELIREAELLRVGHPLLDRGERAALEEVGRVHDVPHRAQLVGEVERYGDIYRLCYVRGPEGIIVELAERLG